MIRISASADANTIHANNVKLAAPIKNSGGEEEQLRGQVSNLAAMTISKYATRIISSNKSNNSATCTRTVPPTLVPIKSETSEGDQDAVDEEEEDNNLVEETSCTLVS